jgi:hypothetical protein
MYKQNEYQAKIVSVTNLELNISIPFDIENIDYINFKIDVTNGVPLEDPQGNVMTQAQVDAFLQTIP